MSDIILGICMALNPRMNHEFNSCLNDMSFCAEKTYLILNNEEQTAKHCLIEYKVTKKRMNRIKKMDSVKIVK